MYRHRMHRRGKRIRRIPMYNPAWNLDKERQDAETYLLRRGRDFSAVYMTTANLLYIAEYRPDSFTSKTIRALASVLTGKVHRAQRQAFFLYRKAADVLAMLICRTKNPEIADQARKTLFDVLCQTSGPAFRAACEALGSLPATFSGPDACTPAEPVISDRHWHELLIDADIPSDRVPVCKGRNLIVPVDAHRLLVVKTAVTPDAVPQLKAEITWMRHLSDRILPELNGCGAAFKIPRPLYDAPFRLSRKTGNPSVQTCFAVAFIADNAYFTYPNESIDHPPVSKPELETIISDNARLLGEVAARGIIHTAPIPLFHNRVQRHRRTDQGLYEWHRGGRLDRWLASCRFPNIGMTGIRDFEHFIALNTAPPKALYIHIGTHIFSLVLIIGSYFRNMAPDQVGRKPDGTPVDVRHLFDRPFLSRAVRNLFTNYYEGFTGMRFESVLPVDIDEFAGRLVDELGVDRHMEEVLRIADQKEMDEEAFAAFLSDRGFTPERIGQTVKGAADIAIETGPHLGDFNDRISLPELTEFTAAAAAMCIAGKYFKEKFDENSSEEIQTPDRLAG